MKHKITILLDDKQWERLRNAIIKKMLLEKKLITPREYCRKYIKIVDKDF